MEMQEVMARNQAPILQKELNRHNLKEKGRWYGPFTKFICVN